MTCMSQTSTPLTSAYGRAAPSLLLDGDTFRFTYVRVSKHTPALPLPWSRPRPLIPLSPLLERLSLNIHHLLKGHRNRVSIYPMHTQVP
ncbi:hypothetical protein NEUTE1DRAFT_103014 [Neurospora tetrasperma FGSC 2508]|uniref:Uncharacterized protein n=1 Tax=Neurospora tetrasperma (strain FGSC 2508 / ATCC MYA-4615 / P0657) TaxID=510951 RepID=F8MUC1_NEUT8|nr:uncharacterized protein NEUTE1DRAFT_103014 [Neurospora tetrasperma FGSC 2508]EGO55603.1 hypothetical protein NEUTE1DRAFT_103014 [Neurospora tetrasperma FGSC 2508]EGZ69153.1 hypothetical protein NEUTE2DRAFT_131568 [Neurospora tetrasperma FGSC 2509]